MAPKQKKPTHNQPKNAGKQQQQQPTLTKAEKKAAKDDKAAEKWRQSLKYDKPHRTFNIYEQDLCTIVKGIRKLSFDEEIRLLVVDGVEYFIVRLEVSKNEEQGLLTYWRRVDLYLLAVGVKGHGLYYMGKKEIVKDAKRLGGSSYDAMKSDFRAGQKAFKQTVLELMRRIVAHEDCVGWGVYVGRLLAFLPEAVRNDLVLAEVARNRDSDDDLFLSRPFCTLAQRWKRFSAIAYAHDPANGFTLAYEDLKLIHSYTKYRPLRKEGEDRNQLTQRLIDEDRELEAQMLGNSKVCCWMLEVLWGYLPSVKFTNHIRKVLASGRGMKLSKIQERMSQQNIDHYNYSEDQLKNILWDMVRKELIVLENGVYRQPRGTNAADIKVGGDKLSAQDIEAILLRIPGFEDETSAMKAHSEDFDPAQFTDSDSNVAEPDSQPESDSTEKIVTEEFLTFYNSDLCDNGAFNHIKNIQIRQGFWESLVCWDKPDHNGYLDERHIEAYLSYLHTQFGDEYKWSGSSFFIPLLRLDDDQRFKCADGSSFYPIEWKRCEKLLWPIHCEEPEHWYLAVFYIRSGKISFYDSCLALDITSTNNFKDMRVILWEKLPSFLREIGWFEYNGVDGDHYEITFDHPPNVPQQKGIYGDCAPYMLSFMKTIILGETLVEVDGFGRIARQTIMHELIKTVEEYVLADHREGDETPAIMFVPGRFGVTDV